MVDAREKLMKIYHDSVIELHQQSGQVNHDDFLIDRMIANGVTVLDEPIKMVIPEGVDEQALMEMIRNAPIQILPGEPVQEWISVKDRLPDSDGDYLVWNDYHKAIVGHYWAKGQYFISKAITVTHWMPLPEPPKEVQK